MFMVSQLTSLYHPLKIFYFILFYLNYSLWEILLLSTNFLLLLFIACEIHLSSLRTPTFLLASREGHKDSNHLSSWKSFCMNWNLKQVYEKSENRQYTHCIQHCTSIYGIKATDMWPKTWKILCRGEVQVFGSEKCVKKPIYMLVYTDIQPVYTKNGIGQKSKNPDEIGPKGPNLISLLLFNYLFAIIYCLSLNSNFRIIN